MNEIEAIVQRMIDAGESEENIAAVIKYYESQELGKTDPTAPGAVVEETVAPVSADTELVSETVSSDLPSAEKDTAIERTFGKNQVTDFFGDLYRAGVQGALQAEAVDPSLDLFRQGEQSSNESINKFIETNQKIAAKNMESDEMKSFNKIYDEAGGGWWGFIKGVAYNPTTLPSMLVSSIATQVASVQSDEVAAAGLAGLGTGAAAGTAFSPIGTVAGGIAGLMGGTMTAMETGLTFSELLQEEVGGELTNANVKKILSDPEKLADLKNKALGRGAAIGAIELATMGLAKGVGGKIAKAGFRGAPATAAAAAGGIEIAGGGTGEVAGRFVAGQEMDVAEIGFEAFAGLGSAPVTMGAQLANLNTNIDRVKINKQLKNTSYKNITEAFSPEVETSETEVNLAKIKNSSKILDEQVDRRVKNNELTSEEGDAIKKNFRSTQQAVNNLSSLGFDATAETEAVALLKEQNTLEEKIKAVNKPSLTTTESERVAEIDARLKEIAVESSVKFAEKGAKTFGIKIEAVESKKEFEKRFGKEAGDSDGFFQSEDGTIYINKEIAKEKGAITVGSHELLHGVLKVALKDMSVTDQNKLIDGFKNSLNSTQLAALNKKITAKDEKGQRLYTEEYLQNNPDEYLTQFSDAIVKNEIAFEENVFTKIGDFIIPVLRKLGFAKIKFNTGKDVYNFLREYNKSIKEGKLSEDISALADQQTETTKEVKSPQKKFSKTASDKVQQLYDEQGEAAALDIINEFKPIVNKLVQKRSEAPNFDRQLLMDEIETGERGLFDLIRAYKPESGVPLAAYINKYLPARAIEASRRILGEKFTEDVTEARGVAATEVTDDIVTQPQDKESKDARKSLRREIDLDKEAVQKVRESVKKTFGTKLPPVDSKKFKSALTKSFRNDLTKTFKNLLGTGLAYKQYLDTNFEKIFKAIPQETLNKKFSGLFTQEVTDEKGKQLREKTQIGKKVFAKPDVTKEEFIDYFTGPSVYANLANSRKTSLAQLLADEIALDATMEVIQEPEVAEKRKFIDKEIF